MFTKGDLLWIPSQAILLAPVPNPESFRVTTVPEVGIFVEESSSDDFFVIIADGKRWVTNRKYVKHLRRENASKVSRGL